MNKKLKGKIKKIKLLALDVDGVLTNGQIVLDQKGCEIKIFDVQDGFGLVLLKRHGIKTAIISARAAGAVVARAKDLGFDKIYQNARPKIKALKRLLRDCRINLDEVCFMGDDLPDLAVLKKVGLAVAVPNAVKEVKQEADYVTKAEGGQGAVREVIELILKSQNKWKDILSHYQNDE